MLIFASIVKSQDISLVSVLKENREKSMEGIEEKVGIENALIAGPPDIFHEIAKVKPEEV
jgi:hypothetical protein